MKRPLDNMMITVVCLLAVAAVGAVGQAVGIVVNTGQGQIKGLEMTARDGGKYTGFLGVPFAQPPVGEYRWKRPLEAQPWQGIWDGTKQRPNCLHGYPDSPSKIVGDEDCLYVNVFTKHPGDVTAKRKVIIWIHGGAFIFGGADIYGADYIMEEDNDVVLVVVQYRLNIFGFLSNEGKSLPGNYGLWDQREAIKWAHKYIEAYGGDSDNISIFGMSAGGASVHYHMLSAEGSRGLFKNAISFSGSALNWWANIPEPKKQAKKLAALFDCPSDEDMAQCLRKIPASKLADAHLNFFDWKPDSPAREPMNLFSPRSDPEADEPFLPEHPIVTMEKGNIVDVPYMLGYALKEGAWRINYIAPDGVGSGEEWPHFIQDFNKLFPLAMGTFGKNVKDEAKVNKAIIDYYQLNDIQAKNPSEKHMDRLVDVSGDSMFNYGIDVTAKLHAKYAKSPTFFEYVTYPAEHSLTQMRTDHSLAPAKFETLRKATHGTDMLLLFNMFPFAPMKEEEVKISRNLIKLVIDFLTNGKSTIHTDWRPLSEGLNHLDIGKEFTVKPGLPFQERIDFWRSLDVYWNATLPGRGSKSQGNGKERFIRKQIVQTNCPNESAAKCSTVPILLVTKCSNANCPKNQNDNCPTKQNDNCPSNQNDNC